MFYPIAAYCRHSTAGLSFLLSTRPSHLPSVLLKPAGIGRYLSHQPSKRGGGRWRERERRNEPFNRHKRREIQGGSIEEQIANAADWVRVGRVYQMLGSAGLSTTERVAHTELVRDRLSQLFSAEDSRRERSDVLLAKAAQGLNPNLLDVVAVHAESRLRGPHPPSDEAVGYIMVALGNRMRNASPAALTAVNFMVDYVTQRVDEFARQPLSMFVDGAARIRGANMSQLIPAVAAHFDADRLKTVRPQGLLDLAQAASRHRREEGARALLRRLGVVFASRLPDFQLTQAILMIRAMSFGKAGMDRNDLAPVGAYFTRMLPMASNADLSRLAEALLGVKWLHVNMLEEALSRFNTLNIREMVAIVRYVHFCGKLNAQLLLDLHRHVSKIDLSEVHTNELNFLAEIASERTMSTSTAAMELGHRLAGIIERRLDEFSPGQCARLLKYLSVLQVASAQLISKLFDRVYGELSNLTCAEFASVLFGLVQTDVGVTIGKRHLHSSHLYNLQASDLTISCVFMIAVGMRKLRHVHQPWVAAMTTYVTENVDEAFHSSSHFLAMALAELFYLNVDVSKPIERLVYHLDPELTITTPEVQVRIVIAGAAITQGVIPRKALQKLFAASPLELRKRTRSDIQDLLAMAAITEENSGLCAPTMPAETWHALHELAVERKRPGLTSVQRCMSALSSLLGPGLAQGPIVTGEGLQVDGALLRRDTACVPWGDVHGSRPSLRGRELLALGGQPIAVLVVPGKLCDIHTGEPLGVLRLRTRALNICGWHVLVISAQHWLQAKDRDDYLLSLLSRLPLGPPHEYVEK